MICNRKFNYTFIYFAFLVVFEDILVYLFKEFIVLKIFVRILISFFGFIDLLVESYGFIVQVT